MSEIRNTLPYVSHLVITKRITKNWVPAGYKNNEGEDLYKQVPDLPGIQCEIVPYLGEIAAPPMSFKFPSRVFFEDSLDEVNNKPVKSKEDNDIIQNISNTLARTDIIWAENILDMGGFSSLKDLWRDVYSDALDEFEEWSESSNSISGIPIKIEEMQWDARVPYKGSKSVQLKIGVFSTLNNKNLGDPVLYTLNYEDEATSKQRLQVLTQLDDRIASITTSLNELPAGPSQERTQLESELERFNNEKQQRSAIQNGLLSSLLSKESIQMSLPTLIISIIAVLQQKFWPSLDMGLVQQRTIAILSGLK